MHVICDVEHLTTSSVKCVKLYFRIGYRNRLLKLTLVRREKQTAAHNDIDCHQLRRLF